jgi:cytochrome c-type biogenesis protein CcmE
MKPRQKRIALIVGGLASLGIAAALALNASTATSRSMSRRPKFAAGKAPQGKAFRIGGLVKEAVRSSART